MAKQAEELSEATAEQDELTLAGEPELDTTVPETGPPDTEETESEQVPAEEEQEETPPAPAVVRNHAPYLADIWASMAEEDQQKVLDGLYKEIDRAPEPGKAEEAEPERRPERQAPEARQVTQPEPAGHPESVQRPDAITDAEWASLVEEMGVSEEALAILKKINAHGQYAVETAYRVGKTTLDAVDATQKVTAKLTQEKEITDALMAHEVELTGLSSKEYAQVCQSAQKLRDAGRVGNWQDAVSLAIGQFRKSDATGASGRRTQARVASSVGGTRRTGARTSTTTVPATVEEAFEQAKRELKMK